MNFILKLTTLCVFFILLSLSCAAISNPAALYCENLGYKYIIKETIDGQQGICVMPDDTELDSWSFLQGTEGSQYSYCAQLGLETESETVDMGSFTIQQAVCVNSESGDRASMEELMESNSFLSFNERITSSGDSCIEKTCDTPSTFSARTDFPTSFDWRNYTGHSYIGSIRNQGTCGSCYAFGAAAAAEGAYNYATGNYDGNVADYSEAYIAWCLGSLPAYTSHFYGCDGSDYDLYELTGLTNEGVIDESNFPYTDTDPQTCSHWDNPNTTFSSWSRIGCNDIDAIKTALQNNGVVDVAVMTSAGFNNYAGGVYKDSMNTCDDSPCYYTATNHLVALVGWGYNASDGEYWILRNSWGSSWGEGGYMRINMTSARVACEGSYIVYNTTPSSSSSSSSSSSIIASSSSSSSSIILQSTSSSSSSSVRSSSSSSSSSVPTTLYPLCGGGELSSCGDAVAQPACESAYIYYNPDTKYIQCIWNVGGGFCQWGGQCQVGVTSSSSSSSSRASSSSSSSKITSSSSSSSKISSSQASSSSSSSSSAVTTENTSSSSSSSSKASSSQVSSSQASSSSSSSSTTSSSSSSKVSVSSSSSSSKISSSQASSSSSSSSSAVTTENTSSSSSSSSKASSSVVSSSQVSSSSSSSSTTSSSSKKSSSVISSSSSSSSRVSTSSSQFSSSSSSSIASSMASSLSSSSAVSGMSSSTSSSASSEASSSSSSAFSEASSSSSAASTTSSSSSSSSSIIVASSIASSSSSSSSSIIQASSSSSSSSSKASTTSSSSSAQSSSSSSSKKSSSSSSSSKAPVTTLYPVCGGSELDYCHLALTSGACDSTYVYYTPDTKYIQCLWNPGGFCQWGGQCQTTTSIATSSSMSSSSSSSTSTSSSSSSQKSSSSSVQSSIVSSAISSSSLVSSSSSSSSVATTEATSSSSSSSSRVSSSIVSSSSVSSIASSSSSSSRVSTSSSAVSSSSSSSSSIATSSSSSSSRISSSAISSSSSYSSSASSEASSSSSKISTSSSSSKKSSSSSSSIIRSSSSSSSSSKASSTSLLASSSSSSSSSKLSTTSSSSYASSSSSSSIVKSSVSSSSSSKLSSSSSSSSKAPTTSTLPNCHSNACTPSTPCTHGRGDCDSNYDCVEGAVCVPDVGASYGCASWIDVCVSTVTTTSSSSSSSSSSIIASSSLVSSSSTSSSSSKASSSMKSSSSSVQSSVASSVISSSSSSSSSSTTEETSSSSSSSSSSIIVSSSVSSSSSSSRVSTSSSAVSSSSSSSSSIATSSSSSSSSIASSSVISSSSSSSSSIIVSSSLTSSTSSKASSSSSSSIIVSSSSSSSSSSAASTTSSSSYASSSSSSSVVKSSSSSSSSKASSSTSTTTTLYPNCHQDKCAPSRLCYHGEGDCDGNQDCVAGAVCGIDLGASYGCASWIDVCVSIATTSSTTSSSSSSSSSSVIASSSSSSSSSSSTSTTSTIVNIACTGTPDHVCGGYESVQSIDDVTIPSTVYCGSTVQFNVSWTGWHYDDENHWGFFVNNTYVGSCTSYADDDTNLSYLMNCSLDMPASGFNNGVNNFTVTGEDYAGYCYPWENDVDAVYTTTVTLANCTPFGHLESYLITPSGDTFVDQNEYFNFTSGVRCVGGYCGDVTATLDPEKVKPTKVSGNTRSNGNQKYVEGEVIVKLKEASRKDEVKIKDKQLNARELLPSDKKFKKSGLDRVYNVKVPEGMTTLEFIELLNEDPNVEYAEPNYLMDLFWVPSDSSLSVQWALNKTNAFNAWDLQQGSSDVVIAIIDTGVQWDHPDLASKIWNNTDEIVNGADTDGNGYIDDIRGWDFTDTVSPSCNDNDCTTRDNDPMDDHGHGTHCAGIAAAATNNAVGMAGMCPNCLIMPVRSGFDTITGQGSLEYDDSALAIIYAADNGADVISMSWGGSSTSSLISDAVAYANSQGSLLIAAAGNSGVEALHYPAGYTNVTAVSSTDSNDERSIYSGSSSSNFGTWVDISAPGSSIYSTYPTDSYAYAGGTSMAAPYISGLAGLVKSNYPYYNSHQIIDKIKRAADDVNGSNPSYKGKLGTGRINASRSLLMKGVVPMNAGTPFYTINQNPVYSANLSCLSNMGAGDSCNQSWMVNATGNTSIAWTFYVEYTSVNYSNYIAVNRTPFLDVTIVDGNSIITSSSSSSSSSSIATSSSSSSSLIISSSSSSSVVVSSSSSSSSVVISSSSSSSSVKSSSSSSSSRPTSTTLYQACGGSELDYCHLALTQGACESTYVYYVPDDKYIQCLWNPGGFCQWSGQCSV